MVILGVGVVGLGAALTTALRSTRETEIQTSAALYAAGLVETLRAEGYLVDGELEGGCEDIVPGCQWRQSLSATDIEGLHEVTVVIERANEEAAIYELRTLLFEPPLAAAERDTRRSRRSESR
jgi:hypothetical protein